MDKDELLDQIKKVIAEKLDIDEEKITLSSSFRTDLGADSLDTFELIFELEEKWNIQISDEVANKFETVGDVFRFLIKELTDK